MRRSTHLAATLLLIAAFLPGSPAAATGPTATVAAYLDDCGIGGTAVLLTTNKMVVRHLRPDGTLRAKHTVVVSGGEWEWGCPGPAVRAGDRFQFIRKGETEPFRVVTVPKLSLRTDRVADLVRGSTPAVEALLRLHRLVCDPADYGCEYGPETDIEAAPDGRFSLPVESLTGLDAIDFGWTYRGDTFGLYQRVATLGVTPGSARVTGSGSKVGQALTVTLTRGSKVVKATTTTRSGARFTVTLRKNGSPFKVKAGDVIRASVASDAVMTVPSVSLSTVDGGVIGVCFPNARGSYLLRNSGGQVTTYVEVETDEDGYWGHAETVPTGTRIESSCANAQGDTVSKTITAP